MKKAFFLLLAAHRVTDFSPGADTVVSAGGLSYRTPGCAVAQPGVFGFRQRGITAPDGS